MSIQALAWVLENSEATLADRLVLLAIANHADARGWNAWPSIPQIAKEARVGRATVFRALEALEALGEIVVERRPGRSSMYGLPFLGSQIETGEGSQIETGGVSSTRQRGPRLRPKPSLTVIEPSRGPARAREATDTSPILGPVPLPDPLPDDVRRRGAEFIRSLRRGEPPS